jgi:hypothetical protein
MSPTMESLAAFRPLIERPDAAFLDLVAGASDASRWPIAVAQQMAHFAERIGDLSVDELQELHDETFGREAPSKAEAVDAREEVRRSSWMVSPSDWQLLIGWLGRTAAAGPATTEPPPAVVESIGRIQQTLVAARNPYHHVLAALYALLRPASARPA